MKDVPREIDILAIASRARELDQRHLDLWMSGHNRLLVCTRSVVRNQEIIYETNACVEQRRISRCSIVRNRALQHMPDAVQFVPCSLRVVLHAQRLSIAVVVGIWIP